MYTSKSIRFFATPDDHAWLSHEIAQRFPNVSFSEEDNRNLNANPPQSLSDVVSSHYHEIPSRFIRTRENVFPTRSYLRIHLPHQRVSDNPNLRDDINASIKLLKSTTIDLIDYHDDEFKKFYSTIFRIIMKKSQDLILINPNINECLNPKPPGAYNLPGAYDWAHQEANYLMNSSVFMYYKPKSLLKPAQV